MNVRIALFSVLVVASGPSGPVVARDIRLNEIMYNPPGDTNDLQYVELRDADTLEPRSSLEGRSVLAVAALVEGTRLIDNLVLGES